MFNARKLDLALPVPDCQLNLVKIGQEAAARVVDRHAHTNGIKVIM
jgi:hypothetical protein